MKSRPNCIFASEKCSCFCTISWRDSCSPPPPPQCNWHTCQHQLAMDICVYFWTLPYIPIGLHIYPYAMSSWFLSWTGRLLLNLPALFSALLYSFYTGDLDFCSCIFNKCSFLTQIKKKKREKWKKISFK